MSGAPAGPLLPPGPWTIAPGYLGRRRAAGLVLRALAPCVFVLFAWYVSGEIGGLRRDAAVSGDPRAVSAPAEFHGKVKSYLGAMARYDGTAVYATPDGLEHRAKVHFGTLWSIDTGRPLVVRYLPQAPDEIATNWAEDAETARWSMVVLFALVGCGLLPWAVWYVAKAPLLRARVATALQHDGREVVARLQKVTDVKQYGRVTKRVYAAELPFAGGVRRVLGEFPPKQSPCFVGKGHLLLATSALCPGEAIVLRADLWPLALGEAERAAALARIAAAGG